MYNYFLSFLWKLTFTDEQEALVEMKLMAVHKSKRDPLAFPTHEDIELFREHLFSKVRLAGFKPKDLEKIGGISCIDKKFYDGFVMTNRKESRLFPIRSKSCDTFIFTEASIFPQK